MAITNAQKKASKNWDAKNREHRNYMTKRSTARGFIRNHATLEDLLELKQIISKKLEEIE